MGEADKPGPPFQPQWFISQERPNPQTQISARWGRVLVTPQVETRPWGQERREPGLAPSAYQAAGVSWTYQKQLQQGSKYQMNSVAGPQGWRTGPTPTQHINNVARGVPRHDGQPSLTMWPLRGMQLPPKNNSNIYRDMIKRCKHGDACWWKDRYCPFGHPEETKFNQTSRSQASGKAGKNRVGVQPQQDGWTPLRSPGCGYQVGGPHLYLQRVAKGANQPTSHGHRSEHEGLDTTAPVGRGGEPDGDTTPARRIATSAKSWLRQSGWRTKPILAESRQGRERGGG